LHTRLVEDMSAEINDAPVPHAQMLVAPKPRQSPVR